MDPFCRLRFSSTFLFFRRSVPDNQRSYALGFQFIFQRSLGFLPGPVLVGWLFDSQCLLWGESCGMRGRCQSYDVWGIAVKIAIFGCTTKGSRSLISLLIFMAPKAKKTSLSLETKASKNVPLMISFNVASFECVKDNLRKPRI